LCAAVAQTQNRERFGISAQAGGVNAVSGQVMRKREGEAPQLLTSQDSLASGDAVTTSYGSQVEILLNPGTYLRLAEKSELVLVDNSLDNLLVRLKKGSAIIETTGPDGVELRIPVVTDHERLTVVRAGIDRINVTPDATELLVQKGRVTLGYDPKNIVKGGKKLTIRPHVQSAIAKMTRDDRDEFDAWSKERGKTLAQANQRLSARVVNGYLSTGSWGWMSTRFGRRWGLWTWSPFASCYTFLPFYYGWGSPYGSSYGSSYGLYGGFGGYYGQPVIVGNQGYGVTPGASGGNSPAPQPQPMSESKQAPQSMPAPVPQSQPDYGKGSRIKDPD